MLSFFNTKISNYKLFNKILFFLKNKLIKSSGIYFITSLFNSLIPFFLLPVITRFLSPTDYGIVAMFMVLVSFVVPFTGFGVGGSVYKQYFVLDKIEMGKYIFNIFLILLVSSLLLLTIFGISIEYVEDLVNIPREWVFFAILVAAMNFSFSVLLMFWQVNQKPLNYGLMQNFNTLLNSGLSVFLIIKLGMSWEGRLIGIITASSLFGLTAILILYRKGLLIFTFSKQYVKNSLRFGIPMIPTLMKDAIISMADKLFLTNFVSSSATGLYSVGLQFSSPISLISTSFNSAYVPILFEKLNYNDNSQKLKIVKFTYLYFVLIITIALIWSIFASFLLTKILPNSFFPSKIYIVWLSLGFAFSGMHSMVVNYIYYAEKTLVYGLLSIFNIFLNVALNYFFVKNFGSVGVAQATCLTYFLFFLITWWLSNRVFPMPWIKRWS